MAEQIFRYDNKVSISSELEPLADVISFIQRLRSLNYTSDLLQSVHGLSSKNEINSASKAIKVHTDSTVALLEQAFGSTTQMAYLPFFYAISHLAKIMIMSQGYEHELEKQRTHGATWSGIKSNPHHLLNDHISLKSKGVFPLLYKAITQKLIPLNKKGSRKFIMGDAYKYIVGVGFEYQELTKSTERNYEELSVRLKEDGGMFEANFNLHVTPDQVFHRNQYKILKGLRKVNDISFAAKKGTKEQVLSQIQRYLIYDYKIHNNIISRSVTLTPISPSPLLLPEEIPIYLAFYHLSNVVRYDPERLYQYFDGEEISLLIALSRHGIYRFLVLFWSFMTQTSTELRGRE